jgi:putative ABC transport system permease protein
MESLLADLRHAFRILRKSPGFTLTAVAAIALGIGANTAIFTVVNAVLLNPLPYPHSDRIVNMTRLSGGGIAIPMFVYWRTRTSGLEDLTAYDSTSAGMNLAGGDRPELIQSLRVSHHYFRLFGATPILGRTPSEEEDRPGGIPVLVMSYGLWQRRFGGNPSLVGKSVDLAGTPYTVVGILSPSFVSNPATEVLLPLKADPNDANQAHTLEVATRLAAGITVAQADAQMKAIGKQYVREHPEQVGDDDKLHVGMLHQRLTGRVRPLLSILMGAVGLVLLIACANVANLLLARATGRQREIAIRAAVGAGRLRIVRQLLGESLLLAGAGAAAGFLVGLISVRVLLKFVPSNLPRAEELASAPALDPTMLLVTLALAVLTGLLFGIFPAIQLSRIELASALKESSGRSGTGLRHNRMRAALAASEMALAVVLLCGAVLLIRSFVLLRNVQPGFEVKGILTTELSLAGKKYETTEATDLLLRRLEERLEKIPGVERAAFVDQIPTEPFMDMIFNIPGRPMPSGLKFHGDVHWSFVSPHYFQVLETPLRGGRMLRDREPGKTVLINEAMAKKYWPKENPVGLRIHVGSGLANMGIDQGLVEIAGVVGNILENGLDTEPSPAMYQPYSQIPDSAMKFVNGLLGASLMVRARPGVQPSSLRSAVERELSAHDTQLAPSKVRTMEQVLSDSLTRQTFNMLLLGVFAGIALVLAAVGIYGVMSYTVEQRTHEIGIRAALGASRADTLRLVVGQGMHLALLGVAAGLLAAFGLTRLMASLLFGVQPADPFTFTAVSVVLAMVALFASWIPALKATRVDPIIALRYE